MTDLKNIQDTRQLVVTWPVGYLSGGAPNFIMNNVNFYVNLPDLYFQPNFAILRSVVISTIAAGRNDRTYRITSNLTDQPLATFVYGPFAVPYTPHTIISIRKPIQQLQFGLEVLVVDNAGNATWQAPIAGVPGPPVDPPNANTYQPFVINLVFDLIAVKDYRSDKVAVP